MHSNTLLLVDGMAAVYRAFFAIKGLSTSDGRPCNAIYGFIRMMDQLQRSWDPSHIAIIFDGGLPTERVQLVPEYKANRSPMPDELREQLEPINDYLEAASIASARFDKCEADDIMATIAISAADYDTRVLLATHDKDLFQLINENVQIVPVTGKHEVMGVDEVIAKTGVSPSQIVDWLALIGDSADNIKGVDGIGPKTATKLLTQYGSIDSVWSHLEELPSGRIKQSLETSRELIERNCKMVKLYTDIDFAPNWVDFKKQSPSVDKLLKFYDRFEFHAFSRTLREPELF